MMGVTQPFLSGAISKTVNMPEDSSVEDIANAYIFAWEQGLKAVAIYRKTVREVSH
jgi:ribonucleoside-diphosphate reductase alpha chain